MASNSADDKGGLLLLNCTLVDLGDPGSQPVLIKGSNILIRNKIIQYVGPNPAIPSQVIDVGGRFVIPGLCDAHVHVTAVTADLHGLTQLPPSLAIARATKVLKEMLLRGITTVRDVGGCDWGLAKAVEEGSILGPRILYSGHALSQTGGHGDFRMPSEDQLCGCPCSRSSVNLGRVCDGVPEVRKAAREELRRGAFQLKIMASGGVASPTDHVKNIQFSAEEISAIVEEASNAGTYVCAHAYTADTVKRALELGVRSIEHGNYVDEECLDLLKSKDAFLVPTLVTYDCICNYGLAAGMMKSTVDKVADLLEHGVKALALAEEKGVNICFGTDLLGSMHDHQLEELRLRSRVQSGASILRSATSTCAKLFRMEGKVGVIAEGAFADLLFLEKNPVSNILSLLYPDNITMILKEGEIISSKPLASKLLDNGCVIKHFDDDKCAMK